ncbi:MAG: NUDIX hydrolase [Candidatus Aenigmatarchaeota archaeon]
MERIPIVDTIVENDGKVLMLKRKFYPENKLDFLGGFVDDGESIEDAAIREVKEESGLDVELVHKLGEYDYFDRKNKKMYVFIGKITGGELQNSEEGDLAWIDLSTIKMEDLAFPQVHIKVIDDFLKIRNG